jgi:hypothetical protein
LTDMNPEYLLPKFRVDWDNFHVSEEIPIL